MLVFAMISDGHRHPSNPSLNSSSSTTPHEEGPPEMQRPFGNAPTPTLCSPPQHPRPSVPALGTAPTAGALCPAPLSVSPDEAVATPVSGQRWGTTGLELRVFREEPDP